MNLRKILFTIVAGIAIIGYGYFAFANAPVGGYNPGETLDPDCTPGSTDCFVNLPVGWSLTGNAGTIPGTNFIGTTDAQDLVFKTNNNEVMRITSTGNIGIGTINPLYGLQIQDRSFGIVQEYAAGQTAFLGMFDATFSPLQGLIYTREWDSSNKNIEFDLSNVDPTKGYLSMSANDSLSQDYTRLGIFPSTLEISYQGINTFNTLFKIISDVRNPFTLWSDGSFAYNDDNFQNDSSPTEQNMFYFNYGNHDGLGAAQTKRAIRLGIAIEDQWDINSAFVGDLSIAIGMPDATNVGNGTIASGFGAIAIGDTSVASGDTSIAIGQGATASGDVAIAIGANSAIGLQSSAFGIQSGAIGDRSIVYGFAVTAFSFGESAAGVYNTLYTPASTSAWNNSDRLFIIGNGDGTLPEHSDALTILKNGQTGIGIDNFEANTNGNIFQVGDGTTNIIGYVDDVTGNWVAVSDERKKENITDLSYGLNDLLQLRPSSFIYKRNGEHTIGFIAQQVLPIIPEAVYGTESEGYGMSYATLTPVIVKAIQEMNLNITDLSNIQRPNTWRDALIAWFGNVENGIGEFVAGTFRAKNQLCINDTCINESELQSFKSWQATQGGSPMEQPSGDTVNPSDTTDPIGTPDETVPDTTSTDSSSETTESPSVPPETVSAENPPSESVSTE